MASTSYQMIPHTMRGVVTSCGLLLVLLLQIDAYGACSLPPIEWKYKRPDTSKCYIAQHNASGKGLSSHEIRLEVKDKADGIVTVEFPLRNAHFYTVSLYVDENATTPETCGSFSVNNIGVCQRHFHSEQRILNSTCDNVEKNKENCDPTCNLMGSVTFEKVYTGCYIAVVARYITRKQNYPPVYSPARLLTTEYEKYPVWKMAPTIGELINIDPGSENYVLTVVVTNFTMLLQERLVIEMFLQNGTECEFDYRGQFEEIAAWTLAFSDDGKLTTENKADSPFFRGCWVDGLNVKCKFINMKTGPYCFGLRPDHPDQCRQSVWTYNGHSYNSCRYQQSFNISSIPPSGTPEVEVSNGRGVTIITIAIVLSLLSVLAVNCIIRANLKSKLEHYLLSRPSPLEIREHVPKVLLLYAQDCEEFMNLMAVFRELLQTESNCEVLDCFDPERNDIASSPCDWMRFWASRPDIKVLVVASPCATVHQKAIAQSYNVCYKDPLNYSDLFRLGLHEVMHNKQKKYSNTFVVRFDDSDLEYIMPYTRYILPQGVKELLKDLNMHADIETLSDSFILKKLGNAHNKLLDRYKRQPDYVTEILFRMKEVV